MNYAIVDLGTLLDHEAANWRDKVFVVSLEDSDSLVGVENVFADVGQPDKRFIYRYATGKWGEVIGGNDHRPYHGPVPSLEVCDVCERIFYAKTRCTNRRCGKCHREHCTKNGATEPGHGRTWPEPVNVGEHEDRLNAIREKIGGRR